MRTIALSLAALALIGGPSDNELVLQRIDADGTATSLATVARADVSSVARLRDGRLLLAFQWFPAEDAAHFDRVAVRRSPDEGRTWTAPEPIEVTGMDAGLAAAFDPALVALPDGRVRM